jgi:hypothetical protein
MLLGEIILGGSALQVSPAIPRGGDLAHLTFMIIGITGGGTLTASIEIKDRAATAWDATALYSFTGATVAGLQSKLGLSGFKELWRWKFVLTGSSVARVEINPAVWENVA